MAHEEDLIDYSDDDVANETTAPATTTNGDKSGGAPADKTKGSYVGVHSTGFRDFLLKPELLKAITDCGFEHPSEG